MSAGKGSGALRRGPRARARAAGNRCLAALPQVVSGDFRAGLTGSEDWSMVSPMGAICVVTTVGTEEQANLIARELVARRHAACVNVVPGVRSTYRWQGKICKDTELLLIVKTTSGEFPEVSDVIQELHSYDLPEILAFDVAQGEEGFLDWIRTCTDKSAAGFDDDEDDEELVFEDED